MLRLVCPYFYLEVAFVQNEYVTFNMNLTGVINGQPLHVTGQGETWSKIKVC